MTVKPLALFSAFLFILAPFLTWLTVLSYVVIRGLLFPEFALQSNLWQIAGGNAGIPVTQTFAMLSLVAAALTIVGGLFCLRFGKVGVIASSTGLASFLSTSFSLFGNNQTGSTLLITSPGIGVEMVIVGIVVGTVSIRTQPQTIELLFASLRTREGLAKTGLFLALVSLTLDGLNHIALQQLPAFLGVTLAEEVLHLGFILSMISLAGLFAFRRKLAEGEWPKRLIASTFLFLLLDGAYHTYAGQILIFFGHNTTEAILHIVTYYGVALVIIGIFLLTRANGHQAKAR